MSDIRSSYCEHCGYSQTCSGKCAKHEVNTVENLELDCAMLKAERDSLHAALRKVLEAGSAEAKARMSLENARENFSGDSYEAKQYERAMMAASNAEREARDLLALLKA